MDTNTVIDYLGKKLPANGESFIDNLLPVLSVVTRMEVLGWYGINPQQLARLVPFFDYATVYPLDEAIILQTISIKQQHKIKLPDAIIAANALFYNTILITRNINDFRKITGLSVINAWDM